MCGACLGFLPHNLSRPARIFLGDGGSMPLGFAVAALTASAARTAEPSALALMTGVLLVGVPALDTSLVIVSRRRRGVSILTGGRDHLTHRTRRRMGTARRVAVVLGSAQALVSGLVVIATRSGSVTVVYLLLALVVCAAAVIVALESQASIATEPGMVNPEVPVTGETVPAHAVAAARGPGRLGLAAIAALAALGLGAGLSPLVSAYYGTGVWVPLGLILVVAAAAAAVARFQGITGPAIAAVIGVAGLGLWSLISTSWAQSAESATVDGNRWLAYAALLVLLAVLTRGRRRAGVLLVALGVGVAVVGVSVLLRMLGSDPNLLFLSGRLNAPLGYINGEGCVFAVGCWLGLALAERREGLLAGLGAAMAVAMACLALLSQSRGAAIASAVAVLVALVAVPGVRRRILALVTIAGGVALAARPVLHVYSVGQTAVSASVAHRAASAVLIAAVVTGVVWGALVAATAALERRDPRLAPVLARAGTALAVLALAVPAVAALARASSIDRTLHRQWHAFVHLSDEGSSSAAQTRLFSGAGNRYDYWRIAWHVFLAHPVAGVGAGNYSSWYYRDRRTGESIENPHSLELQVASELGLVGLGLLALMLAGVAVGARRLRAAARESLTARSLMVASVGAFVVWLVDTSGDWMHLLPGVSAIGLIAAAVLLASPAQADAERRPLAPGRRRVSLLAGTAGLAFLLAIAGASLLRSGLVQHYLDNAKGELGRQPAAAIRDAGRALRLDSANLDAYYVQAAGQARFDQAAAARATLLAAAGEDSHNFVTWTLLGDLEVRLRDFAAARTFYGKAHALDPRDPALAQLAADPASATGDDR